MLAIDVSRSMKAQDVTPTRLDAAKEAANAVPREGAEGVQRRPRRVRQPRLRRRPAHARPLARQQPASTISSRAQGTAIGDAVVLSAQLGQRQRAVDGTVPPTSVLMISDGAPDGGRTSVAVATRKARALHVPVSTVLVGTPNGIVTQKLVGGYTEQIRVPPSPGTLTAIAQRNRRRVLPGADEQRARRRVPASRHADRPPHREPRDHRRLRRRRDRAAARRRLRSPPSGSGGSREKARRARRPSPPRWPRSPPLRPARRTSARGSRSACRSRARGCSTSAGGGSPVPASVPEAVRRRRARRRAQHARDRGQLPRRARQPRQSGDHDDDRSRLPSAARARNRPGRELQAPHRLHPGLGRRPAASDLAPRLPAVEAYAAGDDRDPGPRRHPSLRRALRRAASSS